MSLLSTIKEDAHKALKSGDTDRAGLLRLLLSSVHNLEIEKRDGGDVTLSDEDVEDLLRKEAKKRKESIELYRSGGRDDLRKQEEKELALIEEYLPAPPTEEEIRSLIVSLKNDGITEFPKMMKEAMKRLSGADGSVVARIVKEETT